MPLEPDQMLSHYRLVEKIGEGGMGVVWSAEDTVLKRTVAVKFLPDGIAAQPEYLARFQQEARLLAALNHPHIAQIHGLEQSGTHRFLVLELIPGDTLEDRIRSGPLPVPVALPLACQITRALEAAHAQGIVHRDLKPANVKVMPNGQAKVLDFGLAKALKKPEGNVTSSDVTTIVELSTRAHTVLGTCAYMSPEQARGEAVDRRTDVWAFGCVLLEALTGNRAFAGKSVTETLAGVLEREPDWSGLPDATPSAVRRLLRRCLHKDPDQRLHDIADARIELEEALQPPGEEWPSSSQPARFGTGRFVVGALVGMAVMAAVLLLSLWPDRGPSPITHAEVHLPEGRNLALAEANSMALSADGRQLVYVGRQDGTRRLYVRRMDSFETHELAGTEGATEAFFSPDGRWIGFFAQGMLKKVAAQGGSPLDLCKAADGKGGSWSENNSILFRPEFLGGLYVVSAEGGQPRQVTHPDSTGAEHRWAEFLPGGTHFLFTVWAGGSFENWRIAVGSLDGGEPKILVEGASFPRYVDNGKLLFARQGSLMMAPFDLRSMEVTGPAVPVLDGVLIDVDAGYAEIAVALNGTLIYAPGEPYAHRSRLIWLDRDGKELSSYPETHDYWYPRVSPDGRRVAVSLSSGENTDIWVNEVGRPNFTRLTFEGNNGPSLWSADGQRVIFSSDRAGPGALYWKPVDGRGSTESLLDDPQGRRHIPSSTSGDGNLLAFHIEGTESGHDIVLLPLGSEDTQSLIDGPFDESWLTLSPDGRWGAYQSNESGRWEIWVTPLSGQGLRRQISTDGGNGPVWSSQGELFFRNGDEFLLVAPGEAGEDWGTPQVLFHGTYRQYARFRTYDVASDGQRFLVIQELESPRVSRLRLVLNWFESMGS